MFLEMKNTTLEFSTLMKKTEQLSDVAFVVDKLDRFNEHIFHTARQVFLQMICVSVDLKTVSNHFQ